MNNYYEILGVKKDAGHKDVKTAYRGLVKTHHPDVASGNADPKLFEEITAAYNTLIHAEKRAQYDRSLTAKKNAANPVQAAAFRFREFKEWIFSLSFVRMFFTGKKVSKSSSAADREIVDLPMDELIKRVIFSRNIYVQINAVRAIFARGDSGATRDLLRLLYSGIDASVKAEILNGLKAIAEPRVQDVIRDVYDMEKSLKMKNLIRSYLKG